MSNTAFAEHLREQLPENFITPVIYPPDFANHVGLGAIYNGKKYRVKIEEVEDED